MAARSDGGALRRAAPLSAAALLAALVVGGFYALGAARGPGAPAPAEPLGVAVVEARFQDAYSVVRRYVGRVEPRRVSEAGFERAGLLASVTVDEGDLVGVGEPLARLDTARLDARREELRAALDEARARHELAAATLERTRRSYERGAASDQELDDAETARDVAAATVRRVEREIASVEVELDKSVVRAPFDAVVARRSADEGQVVAVGQPVATLLERAAPEARVGLPPESARALEAGQVVEVVVNGERIGGTVRELLPVTERRTRTVEAVIALDARLDGIRQGDLATLGVERHVRQRGAWLPLEALTESARGLWACYVVETGDGGDRALGRRTLEVLHTDGRRAYVAGALRDGDLVVAGGLHRVTVGQPVRVAERSNLAGSGAP